MMRLSRLWLTDFRCYEHVDARVRRRLHRGHREQRAGQDEPARGGRVGRDRAVVPWGARRVAGRVPAHDEAIVRAEIVDADHDVLVEAAIRTQGRNRVLVNKQTVTRRRDLAEHLRVTVFAPDDLALVKGAPGRPARLRRRPARRVDAAHRGGDHRLRARAEATQRVAARRHPQRGGRARRSTCSTTGSSRRAPRSSTRASS